MKTYSLTEAYYANLQRRVIVIGVPVILLASAAGLWVGFQGVTSPTSLLIVVPIFAVIAVTSLRNSLKQQRKLWASYRLIIEENAVTRTRDGIAAVTISRDAVSGIVEGPALVVSASNPARQIIVPRELQDYDAVRTILNQWRSIEVVPPTRTRRAAVLSLTLILSSLASFVVIALATNAYVIITVGVLYICLLLGGLVLIQRSPELDRATKWRAWLVLILVVVVAWRVIAVVLNL